MNFAPGKIRLWGKTRDHNVDKFAPIFKILSLQIYSPITHRRGFTRKGAGSASRVFGHRWPQQTHLLEFQSIFTARRNARIASAVLATAIPSACLSVRPSGIVSKRRHVAHFALSDSKMCLVLQKPKIFRRDNPFPLHLGSKWPTLSW